MRKIINCANYGEIVATNGVAGIYDCYYARSRGHLDELEIYNCYNLGNLKSKVAICGIGADGIIKNCYNLGNLSFSGRLGDIDTDIEPITIVGTQTNCYALTGEETNEEKATLLNSLNSNREDTTTWSEWKINSNLNGGYPVFEWQVAEE